MPLYAYVVKKEMKKVIDEELWAEKRILERKPLFNLWENEDIVRFFEDYGDSYLCHDQIGDLYINEEQFDEYKENINVSEYEEYSEKMKEVLSFIDNYLSNHFELTLSCF